MDEKLKSWRDEGKHLPDFLRDFHDQKDFFKFMHEFVNMEDNPLANEVNAVNGHAYVIDAFLWVLARHGYTIQKSRTKMDFDNLQKAISESRKHRAERFAQMLSKK